MVTSVVRCAEEEGQVGHLCKGQVITVRLTTETQTGGGGTRGGTRGGVEARAHCRPPAVAAGAALPLQSTGLVEAHSGAYFLARARVWLCTAVVPGQIENF